MSYFDWSCLHHGTCTVNESTSLFKNIFIECVNMLILSKTIVVQEGDKSWYDSKIKRRSRKRDRLKKAALKSGNQNDWKNINITEIS